MERASQTAGIVIIGDEILSGKFADENAAYLIKELRELGVRLARIAVIPDDIDDIAATVARFSERFEHVFTSGGVGPTHDDVTMAGIARAFGTRVVVDPQLADAIRELMGPERGQKNIRLAEVPEGAELVGPGKWPVTRYGNVYILPGVPAIFRAKFDSIKEMFRVTPYATARVYCLGDEGTLAPHMDAVVAEFPSVAVGSYPRFEEKDFRVLVTFEGKDAAAVGAAATSLAERLGDLVVKVEAP